MTAPQTDARDATIAALVESLEWFEGQRQTAIARAEMIEVREDKEVKAICEKYGYGAVMDSASRQWAKKPKGNGAFFIGGCIGDTTAREALALAK